MSNNQLKRYETVKQYHEQTKHLPHRYARSPGYMDWDTQPTPFRLFEGAPHIQLPLVREDRGLPYPALYNPKIDSQDVNSLKSIAYMLEFSMGLSAWKEYDGSQWALRMNPSSGNLHPTECYLILPALSQQQACITHYNPYLHVLEERALIDDSHSTSLSSLGGFGIILTSVHWRESWKYRERAFRYCQHDLGHALGALRYACNLNGWKITLIPKISIKKLDQFLGFDTLKWVEGEKEHADCLCWVDNGHHDHQEIIEWFDTYPHEDIHYQHQPNCLSRGHTAWAVIDGVQEACETTSSVPSRKKEGTSPPDYPTLTSPFTAEGIIRKRRSAQHYNPETSRTDLDTFAHSLTRTLPLDTCPFDIFPYMARVHLALFVHSVEGLDSGLYLFVRNSNHLESLKELTDPGFSWHQIRQNLPLYLLQTGDFRTIAHSISCTQAIAGDSAYSLGMIARFDSVIKESPAMYPRLFWEAGLIGQVLYLEAEAHNLRATGIGCFFDDEMHSLLGLQDSEWQSLYHFTVGRHIEDERLQTKPPYFHLKR